MSITLSLKAPVTKAEIKKEVADFSNQIKLLQADIEVLRLGIQHYRKQCDHKGQVTGMNERDGSWGNPCPTCGYSY